MDTDDLAAEESGPELREHLERWRAAGLLEEAQVRPILDYEFGTASRRPPIGPGSGPGAAEVLATAGAILALVGLGLLYEPQYRFLGTIGGLVVTGGFLVATAALIWFLREADSAPARRVGAATQAVCVMATATMAIQVQLEAFGLSMGSLSDTEGPWLALVAALAAGGVAAGFLLWRTSALVALCLSIAVLTTAWAFLNLTDPSNPPTYPEQVVWIPAGALLIVAGEATRRRDARWAREILTLVGVSAPIVVTLWTGSGDPWLEAVGVLAALLALGASVPARSPGLALSGGISLFLGIYVVEAQLGWDLPQQLGPLGSGPVGLLFVGLVLIIGAYVSARLWPHLRRDSAGPPTSTVLLP